MDFVLVTTLGKVGDPKTQWKGDGGVGVGRTAFPCSANHGSCQSFNSCFIRVFFVFTFMTTNNEIREIRFELCGG